MKLKKTYEEEVESGKNEKKCTILNSVLENTDFKNANLSEV